MTAFSNQLPAGRSLRAVHSENAPEPHTLKRLISRNVTFTSISVVISMANVAAPSGVLPGEGLLESVSRPPRMGRSPALQPRAGPLSAARW